VTAGVEARLLEVLRVVRRTYGVKPQDADEDEPVIDPGPENRTRFLDLAFHGVKGTTLLRPFAVVSDNDGLLGEIASLRLLLRRRAIG
jgi:hypothetical protein